MKLKLKYEHMYHQSQKYYWVLSTKNSEINYITVNSVWRLFILVEPTHKSNKDPNIFVIIVSLSILPRYNNLCHMINFSKILYMYLFFIRLFPILRVDMSLHSDTLFWFWANQSLLLLLKAVCLAEKQQAHSFKE